MTMHTSNTTRSEVGARVAVVVAALLAIWAWAGAAGLIGGGLDFGATVDDRLPWRSLPVAGVALALVVALPMTIAAVVTLRRHPRAATMLLLAGVAQVGWIVGQLLIIRTFYWLQPVCFVAGLAVAGIGWYLRREAAP